MIVHPAISMSNEYRIAGKTKGNTMAALEIIAERRFCGLPISYKRRLCAGVAAGTICIKNKDDMFIGVNWRGLSNTTQQLFCLPVRFI